jgi:hypothetical protein
MQKIMFNTPYFMHYAVMQGWKKMTRRPVVDRMTKWDIKAYLSGHKEVAHNLAPYKIGEIVAIAQAYKDVLDELPDRYREMVIDLYSDTKAWSNKLFVRPDLMPHQIQITDIKVERLQDISDEDVYKEGFRKEAINNGWGNAAWHREAVLTYMDGLGRYKQIRSENPKEAFSFLIDKLSGLGTWEQNDWQFAYSFKLVK